MTAAWRNVKATRARPDTQPQEPWIPLCMIKSSRCAGSFFFAGLSLISVASAGRADSLSEFIAQGTPIVELRVRSEQIDDASKARSASAQTLRARLGYETMRWNGLQLAVDFDQVWSVGAPSYNSTRNGKTTYAVVSDPAMTALNRLQLSYESEFKTSFVLGRQRLRIGNQRFIGNAPWRQHEQTFDALSVINTSIPDLTITYAYLTRVNRTAGPDIPVPSDTTAAATNQASYLKNNSHVLDGVYIGIAGLRLESYAFLLDIGAPGYASRPAQRLAAARLSSATIGGRADYNIPLAKDAGLTLSAEYAHQNGYADNPLSFDLNYWVLEAAVRAGPMRVLASLEVLGGNGTIGFSTPQATLHAVNGWADLFTTTPANGLRDYHVLASYDIPVGPLPLQHITTMVVYHDFRNDTAGAPIGSEWDMQMEMAVDPSTSFFVKYADYHGEGIGAGGAHDKTCLWVFAAYKY